MSEDPQGWFPVGNRLERPHSADGWHPPRPAEDEPIDGPMPPRGVAPGYGTHVHVPRRHALNAVQATRLANDAANDLRIAAESIATAVRIAEEQKSNVEAASGVICEQELLAVAMQIGSVIDNLERSGTELLAAILGIEEATGA